MQMINLNGPKTLTLQPQSVAAVLDALAERPFKIAQPVIEEILAQLQSKTPEGAPPSPPGDPPK